MWQRGYVGMWLNFLPFVSSTKNEGEDERRRRRKRSRMKMLIVKKGKDAEGEDGAEMRGCIEENKGGRR